VGNEVLGTAEVDALNWIIMHESGDKTTVSRLLLGSASLL